MVKKDKIVKINGRYFDLDEFLKIIEVRCKEYKEEDIEDFDPNEPDIAAVTKK